MIKIEFEGRLNNLIGKDRKKLPIKKATLTPDGKIILETAKRLGLIPEPRVGSGLIRAIH
jgi:hypothetical protein